MGKWQIEFGRKERRQSQRQNGVGAGNRNQDGDDYRAEPMLVENSRREQCNHCEQWDDRNQVTSSGTPAGGPIDETPGEENVGCCSEENGTGITPPSSLHHVPETDGYEQQQGAVVENAPASAEENSPQPFEGWRRDPEESLVVDGPKITVGFHRVASQPRRSERQLVVHEGGQHAHQHSSSGAGQSERGCSADDQSAEDDCDEKESWILGSDGKTGDDASDGGASDVEFHFDTWKSQEEEPRSGDQHGRWTVTEEHCAVGP